MIVLNDRIASAYYSQKTEANTLDTFKAYEQGVGPHCRDEMYILIMQFLGGFLNYRPFFYYPASQPTFKQTFDISGVEELPQVDLLIRYDTLYL